MTLGTSGSYYQVLGFGFWCVLLVCLTLVWNSGFDSDVARMVWLWVYVCNLDLKYMWVGIMW